MSYMSQNENISNLTEPNENNVTYLKINKTKLFMIQYDYLVF